MKAIINVQKGSAYAKYNGLTFEVRELMSSTIALDMNGQTTDFNFDEVLIVDLINEFLEYDLVLDYLPNSKHKIEPTNRLELERELSSLIKYANKNKIILE